MRPRNRRRRISLTRKNEPTAFDAIDVEGVGEAFKNTEQLSSDGTTRRRATRVRALAVAMASPTPHRMALCALARYLGTSRPFDAEASELYNMASAAVQSGDDDTARTYLTERKTVQTKLEDAKRRATEAKARVARVEASVETLSSQAKKLESILKENMAAAAERNASEAAAKFEGAGESLGSAADLEAMFEDPLEKKFRDLEGR